MSFSRRARSDRIGTRTPGRLGCPPCNRNDLEERRWSGLGKCVSWLPNHPFFATSWRKSENLKQVLSFPGGIVFHRSKDSCEIGDARGRVWQPERGRATSLAFGKRIKKKPRMALRHPVGNVFAWRHLPKTTYVLSQRPPKLPNSHVPKKRNREVNSDSSYSFAERDEPNRH